MNSMEVLRPQSMSCIFCTFPIKNRNDAYNSGYSSEVRNLCSYLNIPEPNILDEQSPITIPICTNCFVVVKAISEQHVLIQQAENKIEKHLETISRVTADSTLLNPDWNLSRQISQGDLAKQLREKMVESYRQRLLKAKRLLNPGEATTSRDDHNKKFCNDDHHAFADDDERDKKVILIGNDHGSMEDDNNSNGQQEHHDEPSSSNLNIEEEIETKPVTLYIDPDTGTGYIGLANYENRMLPKAPSGPMSERIPLKRAVDKSAQKSKGRKDGKSTANTNEGGPFQCSICPRAPIKTAYNFRQHMDAHRRRGHSVGSWESLPQSEKTAGMRVRSRKTNSSNFVY